MFALFPKFRVKIAQINQFFQLWSLEFLCIWWHLLWVNSYANEKNCKQWRQQRFYYGDSHTQRRWRSYLGNPWYKKCRLPRKGSSSRFFLIKKNIFYRYRKCWTFVERSIKYCLKFRAYRVPFRCFLDQILISGRSRKNTNSSSAPLWVSNSTFLNNFSPITVQSLSYDLRSTLFDCL